MRLFYVLIYFITFSYLSAQSVKTLTNAFNASGDVAVNHKGEIFVADYGKILQNANGTKIYKVSKDGTVKLFADGLQGASGLDFDSKGNLYQSNIAGGKISKITPDGRVTTFASENINSPIGIVVSPEDTVYCVDCSGQLIKIDPQGNVLETQFDKAFKCPNGLTMDDEGNLYTSNFGDGWVVKITPQGKVNKFVQVPGNGNAHIEYANGKLYVVARCVNQIYQIDLDGSISLFAGSGEDGTDDGSLETAQFRHLNGIAASPDGDTLYVNDVSLDSEVTCANPILNPVVVRMITLNDSPTSVLSPNNLLPETLQLKQNYPNPFNPSTTIHFNLSQNGHVKLTVFNTRGEIVKVLINQNLNPGEHQIKWTGFDNTGIRMPSGTYFYSLEIDGKTSESRKMVLLK